MEINLIPKDRNLFLSEQVDQESIDKILKKIIEINESDEKLKQISKIYSLTYKPEPIKLYIDSFGGNAYQAFGIISVIESSKIPIHTICTGAAMSAGFLILISGHKRFAYKYSTPLYHQVASFNFGKLKDLEDDVAESKRLQKIMEKFVLEKTKISKDKLKQVYTEKIDWYMSSEEALKLGVIDEIL